MRYSGIQPQYFPRLHYFARALATDTFVLRDEVQFVIRHKYPDGKNGPSYQAHCPIAASSGTYLLTVPTTHQGLLPINKTLVSYNHSWVHKHLKTLEVNYSRSTNFSKIQPDIKWILNEKPQFLSELNIQTFLWGINILLDSPLSLAQLSIDNINKILKSNRQFRLRKILPASSIKQLKDKNLSANEKILTIIKTIGADEDYTGGTAAQAYMNHDLFEKRGVKVIIQDWKCQTYPQLFAKKLGFIANLSIIDLLMNVSLKQAVDIING